MAFQERIDQLEPNRPNPFLGSPADYLSQICAQQIATVRQFKSVFGEFIDGYMRQDYAMRNLPAVRIYNDAASIASDNWFLEGTLTLDIILPASIRRAGLQNISDILVGAFVQQFRRNPFFVAVSKLCPGLIQLGQSMNWTKNLAYRIDEDETMVPLAQMTANFKFDLVIWNEFLERQGRTQDDPFEVTLAALETVATTIAALNDDGTDSGVEIDITQTV